MKWIFWSSKAKFKFWVLYLYLKFPNHDINPYLNLAQCRFLHSIPFSISETGYTLVSSFLHVMWVAFIFMIVWNFSNEIPCFWRLWAVCGVVDVIFYTVFLQTVMYFLLAPYEFLHDITCLLKKPFKSQYRQAVVSRFWTTLKNLSRSDQLLVHLSSFPSNPATYTIPESIRSGMPVFYLPANSSIPVLSSRWEPVVSFQKLNLS